MTSLAKAKAKKRRSPGGATVTRLAWITDTHLDHCQEWQRLELAEKCAAESDCLLITGDITSGKEMQLLTELSIDYAKPIYFVLGNHDYWGGSFASVKAHVRDLCARRPSLTWLDDSPPVTLAPGVQLCGIGGWYDAQLGEPEGADFVMNDWVRITDLRPHYFQGTLVDKCRELGLDAAMMATAKLAATAASQVIFATHVPPFAESAWHEGRPSGPTYLPWYTCHALGFALNRFADSRPDVKLTTLCGHVHSESIFGARLNHFVHTGASKYGAPAIARVFKLGAEP